MKKRKRRVHRRCGQRP